MLISLFLTTFVTVFFAELGDKTQLSTIALGSTTKKPLAVFIGSSTALVLACFIGAIAGGSIAVSNFVPTFFLKILAAIVFLYIGSSLILQSTKLMKIQKVNKNG